MTGLELFSGSVEFALPMVSEHPLFDIWLWMRMVSPAGWQSRSGVHPRLPPEFPAISVGNYEATVKSALIAHGLFPQMFAVAWDIALTELGPVFLEGNTGFGATVPQWVSGGSADLA